MQKRCQFLKKITAISLLFAFAGCALYRSKPVTDAVNEDRIKIGMSPKEVRWVLGEPDEVAKRKVPGGEDQEVWTYYEYGPNLRGCIIAFFDSCTAAFVPFKPKLQYVVFENNRLVGWNTPNPFQPALQLDEKNLP